MELGEIKYVRTRLLALFFLFIVTCIGLGILYIAFLSGDSRFDDLFPLLHVVGFMFSISGIGLSIEHYYNGIAYTQEGKISLNELDRFVEYDNGLLVVFENWARLLTFRHNKILDRGYVRITNEFDRHKKLKGWILID